MIKKADKLIKDISDFISDAEYNNITDEQWFINFEMLVSLLVTKDHNIK